MATVAVAANFKATLDLLEADFEATSSYELETVVGSTGKLYAQIVHGAPYDIFLAADQARPSQLVKDGAAQQNFQITYALGRVLVWRAKGPDFAADALFGMNVRRIAMANPELAPYGRAAQQVLGAIDPSSVLAPKLVLGENAGQAFAFVATGNAQFGFVSEAQILSLPADRRGGVWRPPGVQYAPIAQDAVLLARAEDNAAAQAFFAYLSRPAARRIIAAQGYDLP
ncbi:MAG: molybdate ABC transporter substrate-binding protein [Pseudomonadota bacterium]